MSSQLSDLDGFLRTITDDYEHLRTFTDDNVRLSLIAPDYTPRSRATVYVLVQKAGAR